MGEQNVKEIRDESSMREFTRTLIQDVRAMEHMLNEGMFEGDVRRVGAEQELFLIDEQCHPAHLAMEVLEHNTDERLVTELTRFNLEFNMTPHVFEADCFGAMERELNEMLVHTRALAHKVGAEIVMTGILPTIHISDLTLDNLTPKPRYFALNDALNRLRGGPAQFQIRGVDELFVKHDTIMLEGCNTSFQTHFQVAPEEFAHYYNISQAVAAPVLAAAVNSPLLFGKRLWQETRIALFQQAVDTRSSNLYLREMAPRVHFGSSWVKKSVLEIYKEDISRFRVLLTAGRLDDPFDTLKQGDIPSLKALQLHYGTVYRWNRACYGITDGKPHLRIENRILPSGPSALDAVANAAFWFGLVCALAGEFEDISKVMEFDDAKNNFIGASRLGLGAQFTWLDGRRVAAPELIGEELLPLARKGLQGSGINAPDIDRLLGVIEARVSSGQNGAQWQLDSLVKMKKYGSRAERLTALVSTMVERQKEGKPIHEWPLANFHDASLANRLHTTRVEHYMTTDLFTVDEDELVEFVATLMDWQRLRHVLVEDHQHKLVGLVSHRSVLRYLAEHGPSKEGEEGVPVKEIMIKSPISVRPETLNRDAIALMRDHRIGALPVVRDGQLVGLVTERDFLHIAGQLLDESIERAEEEQAEKVEAQAAAARRAEQEPVSSVPQPTNGASEVEG